MSSHLFEHDDANYLENGGIIGPVKSGFRPISGASLLSLSSSGSNSQTDSEYASSSTTHPAFLYLPDSIESEATLVWLGFEPAKAKFLFQSWQGYDPNDIVEFPGLVTHYIKHFYEDVTGADDDEWNHLFSKLGITQDLKNAILDPQFKQIRLTESCKDWLIDTFEGKFCILTAIQGASRKRAKLIQDAAKRGSTEPVGMIEILGGPREENSVKMQTNAYPQHSPGSTTLWKGGDKAKFAPLFQVDGTLTLQHLCSLRPTDFCRGGRDVIYTTVHREVAELYANFAKRRIGDSATPCIVSLQVPNSLIQSLNPLFLQYGELWQNIVWNCRWGQPIRGPLREYTSRDLIIGPICGKPNKVIAQQANLGTVLEGDIVKFMSEGEQCQAIQYAFLGEETLNQLELKGTFALHEVTKDAKDFIK